jgi:hypothetical protein
VFLAIAFALDSLKNFFTVHSDMLRGINPDTHLVTFYTQHSQRDLVADHYRLTDSPSQNKHWILLNMIFVALQMSLLAGTTNPLAPRPDDGSSAATWQRTAS